jgi:hypothetical protein
MILEERTLLEAFVVDNPDLEQLESLLAEFNIFEAIGAVRQELRHSDFLAFLLNPAENHGLSDIFLKKFLMRVLTDANNPPFSAIEIDVSTLQEAEIRREWRNIDILVHDPTNRLVCTIENKVDTTEYSNQLRRYREIVSREFPGHRAIFVYLTPEGDEASDETYVSFNYTQIGNLIDYISQAYKSTLGPDVYTLMIHYPRMLRRHIVSDSEIAELCRKIYQKHQKALDLIFEHRPDLQLEIANKLVELIENAKSSEGFLSNQSDYQKRHIYFADSQRGVLLTELQKRGWVMERLNLYFDFYNTPDQLSLKLYIGPSPNQPSQPVIQQTLYQLARNHPAIFRGVGRRLSNWTVIYKRQFLVHSDYEEADFDSLTGKIQSEWHKFLIEDLPAIRQALIEIEWPAPNAST